MTTPILGITEVAAAQVNQYAVVNAAIRALEGAGNDFATVDLSSGNVTLTAAQFAADLMFRSSGNTVTRTLTVPAAKRLFVVHNNGTGGLNVARGSKSYTVNAGDAGIFYADGTTNGLIAIASGGSGSDSYSTAASSSGALDISNAAFSTWRVTLTENITTITLPTAASGRLVALMVVFQQDGTGGRTVSGWSGVTWESGSAPTVASGAGALTSVPLLIFGDGLILGAS